METYTQAAKRYLAQVKSYVVAHWQQIAIGTGLVAFAVFIVALFVYNNPQRVVYQPVKACDLFTVTESHELLGKDTAGKVGDPKLVGDLATSQCTFSDLNKSKDLMKVAAVVVRSGVNDGGVAQNKDDFQAKKPAQNAENVKGLGDTAYFDHTKGQLNVLDNRDWYIFSYGIGATPEANTLDDAIKLARVVLP